jgi:hypothetical protein
MRAALVGPAVFPLNHAERSTRIAAAGVAALCALLGAPGCFNHETVEVVFAGPIAVGSTGAIMIKGACRLGLCAKRTWSMCPGAAGDVEELSTNG